MPKFDLSIAIPVYNEEKTIRKILEKTCSLPIENYEVIVVDDASKDKSPQIIKEFFSTHKGVKSQVIRHETNKGKGAGIKSALKVAQGEYFVVQDADYEYDPKDIPKLISYAQDNNQNVVYGSRFLGEIKDMPKANYLANVFYNTLLRVLYGVKMTDMHTCYKMVKTDVIKELHLSANGFDYATELISKLLSRGEQVNELPITFKGRTKQEGKKINYLDGIECLYKLVVYRILKNDELFKTSDSTTIRFLLVGLIGFFANYTILVICAEIFNIQHVVAEVIAVVTALHVTFILHDRWTYRLYVKKGSEKLTAVPRYLTFMTSNSLGALITVIVFAALYAHMYRSIALLIAAIAGLMWNYFANKYITWSPKN